MVNLKSPVSGACLLNPWAVRQYAHNMTRSRGYRFLRDGGYRRFLHTGWTIPRVRQDLPEAGRDGGHSGCIVIIFPTGDLHGKYVAHHQPAAWQRWKACSTRKREPTSCIMGQPDYATGKMDNPIVVDDLLSFLIYGTTKAEVVGLDQFPKDQWPTTLPLLFYAYHIMAGLGTYFLLLMLLAAFQLWRGKLANLQVAAVAADAQFSAALHCQHRGMDDAEIGRQPWVVLRPYAHRSGLLKICHRRQRPVYPARLHGDRTRSSRRSSLCLSTNRFKKDPRLWQWRLLKQR